MDEAALVKVCGEPTYRTRLYGGRNFLWFRSGITVEVTPSFGVVVIDVLEHATLGAELWGVEMIGLPLDQLRGLLNSHGFPAVVHDGWPCVEYGEAVVSTDSLMVEFDITDFMVESISLADPDRSRESDPLLPAAN